MNLFGRPPSDAELESDIDDFWERRDTLTPDDRRERKRVDEVLDRLDDGSLRVAEPSGGGWVVHQWLKKAVLLSFRLNENRVMQPIQSPDGVWDANIGPWWDKVPNKFKGWNVGRFKEAGFRTVPAAIVRRGAFIDRNAVLMPSFVNIGAYVGEG